MEPESSLPRLQVPATCPYPEPDRSSPYCHIPLPKVKTLKVARLGLYSTAALYIADCALAPNVVPSFIPKGATTPSGAGALY
jgi:hypothetical protein